MVLVLADLVSEDMTYWWEKEPLRIIEICNAYQMGDLSLQEEADAVKKMVGNAQHFHCTNEAGGGDDKRFYFKTQVSKADNPDRLGKYLPIAHKTGIKVIVYFNVHWYSKEFGREHPDWLQIKEDGKPLDDVYTTGTSLCINSPYREWVFQILRDLCRYPIDGIFYDGPIFFAQTCYCETCRRLFKQRTGEEIPKKSDHNHPLWRELVEFQADSLARFLSDSREIIKAANPEILFCMNGNANWPYWPTGRDNHKIIKHTDILGAEGGFIYGDLNLTSIYKPGMTAKLLSSQSQGKPALVFDCAGHKSWSWYMLPEPEISLLLAETLAGGANFWVPFFPDDLKQPEIRVVRSYCELVKKNPKAFGRTRSMAKVALLWPAASVELYEGSSVPLTDFTKEIKAAKVGDISQEFLGFYEGLARSQVPFDVIDEANLVDLSRYELLVLPNATCLSDEACRAISDFVGGGGNLVASFETSLYDEDGRRREDLRLGGLFGARFSGRMFGPMLWDYVAPDYGTGSPLLKGVSKEFIPAPAYGIEIKTTVGKPLAHFCTKLVGCYDHSPEVSDLPFIVTNRHGKGTVVYLAGTFGISLSSFRFPEYLTLVRNVATKLSAAPVLVENAPWVEVNVRRNDEAMFVHLVNQTSGLKRPMTHIQPLTDLEVVLPKVKCKQSRTLRQDRKLRTRVGRRGTSFTLPLLEDYEVIELPLET